MDSFIIILTFEPSCSVSDLTISRNTRVAQDQHDTKYQGLINIKEECMKSPAKRCQKLINNYKNHFRAVISNKDVDIDL